MIRWPRELQLRHSFGRSYDNKSRHGGSPLHGKTRPGAPAVFLAQLVVADRALAGACDGDYRHDLECAHMGPKPVGVEALIGQKTSDVARSGRQHLGAVFTSLELPGCEMENGGAAEDVGKDVNPGVRRAARWSDSLSFAPLCCRGCSDAPWLRFRRPASAQFNPRPRWPAWHARSRAVTTCRTGCRSWWPTRDRRAHCASAYRCAVCAECRA